MREVFAAMNRIVRDAPAAVAPGRIAASLGALAVVLGAAAAAFGAEIAELRIGYLTQRIEAPPPLSNLLPPPADEGVLGGRLALEDNNTTGRFTKQKFILEEAEVAAAGELADALQALIDRGVETVVANLEAEALLRIADLPAARELVIFNVRATDDALRNEACRANVVHMLPSRAMLADALAQYFRKKRWSRWFLVVGPQPADRLYAAAIRRAAKRFGAKIVEEKVWNFGPDARRVAQAEVPVFTQGNRHDVLVVADERGEFGEYLMYRTWKPTLVAGTQGLTPTAWHWTHERWGAAQVQRRFRKRHGRSMTDRDYATYLAVRAIGEAATRTGSVAGADIAAYLNGPEFVLQAYKGVKVSIRPWNGQLRQPVLLAAARSLVSVSPQQGFLHHLTPLDSLGYDKPETACRAR